MVHAGRHARRWGAYAALGIAACLILSGGVHGYPDPRKAGGKTTPSQTPKPVEKGSAPSVAASLHSDIQRLAAALEEHNRYEKSADAQKDAHTAAQGAVIINAGEPLDLKAVGEMRPVGPMGPKDSLGDDVPIDDLLHGRDAQAHVADGKEIHLFGRIEYDTDFAKNKWTTFHSYVDGDVPWDLTLHTAKTGNDFD